MLDAAVCAHALGACCLRAQIGPQDDEEELKDTVMEDMADIFSKVDKGGEGVCVQVSVPPSPRDTRSPGHSHATQKPEPPGSSFELVAAGGGRCTLGALQASTLGSLEALLTFLDSDDVKIPVSGINIGPVHKRDVLRANVMNEKGAHHCLLRVPAGTWLHPSDLAAIGPAPGTR